MHPHEYLVAHIQEGMTIYYVCRKRTYSGRTINEFYIHIDGRMVRITRYMCDLLCYVWKDGGFEDGGLISKSSGSDVVCRLSEELFQGRSVLKWEQL